MKRVPLKVLALLAALTLVWGTNWPLFAIALSELPVATFRTGVLSIAIVTLGLLMRLRGDSLRRAEGPLAAPAARPR